MISLSAYKHLDQWNNDSIRPGLVGSVGDALVTEQVKSSLPGDYSIKTPLLEQQDSGSNVQDGYSASFVSGGMGGEVYDNAWEGNRSFKTPLGWFMQDVRLADRTYEPILGSTTPWDIARIAHQFEPRRNVFAYRGVFIPEKGFIPRGPKPVITRIEETQEEYNYKPDLSITTEVSQQQIGLSGKRSGEARMYNRPSIGRMF